MRTAVLFVALAVAGCGQSSRPQKAAKEDPKSLPVVVALELLGAYSDNQPAADKSFKGRRIVLVGHVDRVSSNRHVSLHAGGIVTVGCDFRQAEAGLLSLSKDTMIRVAGTVRHGNAFGVKMSDCYLVTEGSPPPDQPPPPIPPGPDGQQHFPWPIPQQPK